VFLPPLAALILVIALAVGVIRSARQRTRLEKVIRPNPGETLEGAIGRLLLSAAQAEGESAELTSSFEQLMANFPLPVLLLDEDLVITNLSHRAETELDQPRRERSLMEGLESNELELAARDAIHSLKPAEITVRLYAAGRRTYHARLIPFRAGQKRRCLIFLQSAAATVEFGELRSQFAATVSHELRTPLAGIRAMVETLKDPEIPSEDRERFLEKIDRETNRLGQLVDDILFLSSLESGAASLEGVTELRPLLDSLLEKLAPITTRFEAKIKNGVPDGLTVNLPERMVSTIISNLLENAIKYSGRGSHVEVIAVPEGSFAKLHVKDDGIGIDAEHLPHIFERFYRVDKSRSRRLGGTGLGLSIVKHVVESAGGTVSAKSREGFGTEITVMLPLAS